MTTPDCATALDRFTAFQAEDNPGQPARAASRMDLAALCREAAPLAETLRAAQQLPDPAANKARLARAYATIGENYLRNQWRVRVRHSDVVRPLYAIYSLLDACNHRCVYCDDHTGCAHPDQLKRDRRRLDTDEALRLLEILRTGVSAIFYTGGETMLRPDLPKLMRHAATLGFYPQTLNSNATLAHRRLLEPGWERLLADTDVLSISLDSLCPSTLTEMYGAPALPKEDILRNILALRLLADEYGFRLGVNVVIQPGQIGHARDVLDFANAFGITFAGVPQNQAAGIAAGLLSDPDYQALAQRILQRQEEGAPFMGPRLYNRGVFLGEPLCVGGQPTGCRPVLKPYIEPDGTWEAPCNALSKAGKARVRLLDYDTLDEAWEAAAAQVDFTDYHERCGGSCQWAQHVGANYYYYGLFHPLRFIREAWAYSHDGH